MIVISPRNTLLLPGWQNSGPDHWQSRWEALHGYHRVEQHDWMRPLRGDWSARLEETVADADGPVLLVAHSLGCILTAWWAAHTRHAAKVRGALLVAPADVERPACAPALRNFAPIPTDLLPFPSQVVSSDNDAAVSAPRAMELARNWGAEAGILAGAGHINVKSGHQRWEQGFAYLYRLQNRMEHHARRRA